MDPTQQQNLLNTALEHHQANRLPEAEAAYRKLLASNPNNPDALHLLGVIAHQRNQSAEALDLISRAIAISPNVAAYYNNYGEALRNASRFDEASAAYQRAIQIDPHQADAWSNLSMILRMHGRNREAADAARRAIAIRPNFPNAYLNLGTALVDLEPEASFQALNRTIQLDPNSAAAYCNLALLLTRANRHADSITASQRAIQLQPDFIEAYVNLSLAAISSEKLDIAIEASKKAIQYDPRCSMAYTNLGLAYSQSLRHEDAIEALKHSIAIEPLNHVFHKNLGVGYIKIGQVDQAIAAFTRCLELQPEYAEGHFNYAMALLTKGDLLKGFEEYDWRWRFDPFVTANPRTLPSPWKGQDLTGKTIVLAYEQGFGDSIHFVRYARILAGMGATCVLFCPTLLHSLLRTVPGISAVYAPATPPPPCDYQVNLLTIPHILKTTLDNIPHEVPYVFPAPEKLAQWKTRLDADNVPAGNLRVGLCWTGNHKHFNDRLRSIDANLLAPLGNIPNVTWYSLQKRADDAPPIKQPPFQLIDHTAHFEDFTDSASLLTHLDLMITVDTATAHLAGALAKPTWTLLPTGPDFRWLLDRNDTPWYPTMTLYRQPTANDWQSVLDRIVADLTQLASK